MANLELLGEIDVRAESAFIDRLRLHVVANDWLNGFPLREDDSGAKYHAHPHRFVPNSFEACHADRWVALL